MTRRVWTSTLPGMGRLVDGALRRVRNQNGSDDSAGGAGEAGTTGDAVPDDDLFCNLYVAGAADADALTVAVDEIVRRARQGAGRAETSVLDIAVRAECRHLPLDDEQDDFLLWRHHIDIEVADPRATFDAFLAEVVEVVVGLRAGGLGVVAACDFEEELEAAAGTAGSR